MSAVVCAFVAKRQPARPWQNRELAEFYRVIDILGRAGISVVPDMGVSDEGDPWFVFCRADTGEVVVHCARIDDQFVANSVAFNETFVGRALRDVINSILKSAHFNSATTIGDKRLYLHPVAVFTAFIAAALLFSKEASAQSHSGAGAGHAHSHGEIALQKVIAAIKTAIADGVIGGTATDANSNQVVSEPLELTGTISLAALMSAALPTAPTIDSLVGLDASTLKSVPAQNQYDGYASIFDSPSDFRATSTLQTFQQADDPTPTSFLAGLRSMDVILAGSQSPPPSDSAVVTLDPTSSLVVGSNDTREIQFTYVEARPVHLVAAILAIELEAPTADALITPDGHPFALTGISPTALAILFGTPLPLDQTGAGTFGEEPAQTLGPSADPTFFVTSPVPSVQSTPSTTISNATSSSTIVSQTDATTTGPTTIVLAENPIGGLEQILDYALGSHSLSGTFAASALLESVITNLTPSGSAAPTLLIFDGASIKLPVFEFSAGVLLVDDQQIGITPHQVPVDNLVTVDLANGGIMTLLGVVATAHLLT